MLRRLLRADWVLSAAGALAAAFLRLVWRTNRFALVPHDVYAQVEPDMPVIIALWHGQHFMAPFIRRAHHRAAVLISRHRDGEINARAAERLHIETVRGSGDHGSAFHRKGGVGAFKEMLRVLERGTNMALTADVPKRARIAGLGIVMLARESGRPIVPVAMATSRFWRFDNWDRTTIGLPFGRGALVGGDAIFVPPDADAAAMEDIRIALERALNAATRTAYAEVGRRDPFDLAAAAPAVAERPLPGRSAP